MRLDSVRELKQRLLEPIAAQQWSVGHEERAYSYSIPAGRATEIPLVQPTLALGVAPRGDADFALAVRVQHRDLLDSHLLATIRDEARGELDIRYVGRLVKRDDPKERTRPLLIGCSVGHYAITAGTLGAFVHRSDHDERCLLSNNHVLADENRAAIGDEVLQPGKFDGGRSGLDRVGQLGAFIALDPTVPNAVDCAIAVIDDGVDIDATNVTGLGTVAGIAVAEEADLVSKLGRTTGLTHGSVTAFDVDNVCVEFAMGVLRFDGQIEISGTEDSLFSDAGDSGSLIVTADDCRAVGLLFAGSDQGGPEGYGVTFANPIDAVFAQLGVAGAW
jgi:hypothetical protein